MHTQNIVRRRHRNNRISAASVRRRTAYALDEPTVAITVITTCSLRENGPGFKEMPNILYPGTVRAHAQPRGKERSWATSCARSRQRKSNNNSPPYPGSHVKGEGEMSGQTEPIVTLGYRKWKNWLRPGMKMAQKSPIVHARRVSAGISMSSVLETAARTSG